MAERITVAEIPNNDRTEVLLKQAAEILFACVSVEGLDVSPVDTAEKEYYLDIFKSQRLFVAVIETGDVIGAATMYERQMPDSRHSELSNIGVIPEYRRNRIGDRLISAAEKAAMEDGLDEMVLYPLDNSRPFYFNQGFELLTDRDGKYMAKKLA